MKAKKMLLIVIIGLFVLLSFSPKKYSVNVDRKEYLAGIDDVTDAKLKACITSDNEYSSGLTSITELKCVNQGIKDTTGIKNLTGLKRLELQENQISSIDLNGLNNLEYLAIANNVLTSLDVSHNTKLKSLYVSSNKDLKQLNVSSNSILENINTALTGISTVQGLTSTNLKHLKVTDGTLSNYNLSSLTHLERVGTVHYKLTPIYGKTLTKAKVLSTIPSTITLNQYALYDFSGKTDQSGDFSNNNTYTGEYGGYYRIQVYADDDKGSAKNSLINNSNLTVGFNGYYEYRFMTLTSSVYEVDEVNKTIKVGNATDSEILPNVQMSWEGAVFSISGNTLSVYYENQKVVDFTLLRSAPSDVPPANPGTSVEPIPNTAAFDSKLVIFIGMLLLMSGLCVIGYCFANKKQFNN